MKAASAVLTGAQRPLMLFGIPPQLFLLAAGGGAMAFGVFIGLDLMALALVAAVATTGTAWSVLYRKTREDRHLAGLLLLAPRFWRGRRTARRLVAGAAPMRKGGRR